MYKPVKLHKMSKLLFLLIEYTFGLCPVLMHVNIANCGKNAVFNGYRPVCRQYAGEWSEMAGDIMIIARFKGGAAIVVRVSGWYIMGVG